MGKKIINKIDYDIENPEMNKFVQFLVEGQIYHRFRNSKEGPYPAEIFYNSLRNEFGIKPEVNNDSDWTKKEGVYEMVGAGRYECSEDGFIYLEGNGVYPSPTQENAKKISKLTGIELIVKG